MKDLFLLATPIILGWCASLPLEAWLDIDTDFRWNHALTGIDNPRRLRPPPCEVLEDLSGFGWEWESVCAAISTAERKEHASRLPSL